jgi:transcriptional regulator with XRE-family HTH domain
VSYLVNSIHAYFLRVKTHKSYTELSERIVRLLRDERIRQGLSKYALEQRGGVSQQMVGYVERGLRRPSLETALRIADGLGVDLGIIIRKARAAVSRKKK